MYYVTTDSDDERILENAEIVKVRTHEEARGFLLDSFAEVEEGYDIKILPGHYGDCWKKTSEKPRPDNTNIQPFRWSEVVIQFPVAPPFGNFGWWITPGPQVLVAKLVKTETPS